MACKTPKFSWGCAQRRETEAHFKTPYPWRTPRANKLAITLHLLELLVNAKSLDKVVELPVCLTGDERCVLRCELVRRDNAVICQARESRLPG
jgi:hypothetical protein